MAFDFGSMFGKIGGFLNSPVGSSLLDIGSGLLGSKTGSDRQQGALADAAAYGRTNPYSVFSPIGNVVSENGTLQFQAPTDPYGALPQELLDESAGVADLLGSQRDVYGTLGAGYLGELEGMGFDPQAAAQNRYDLLTQAALPQQNRMFQNLEQRLFGRGQLGTTGGGEAYRGFYEAANQADLQRQLAGQEFAMNQQSHLANLGSGFSDAATNAAQSRYGLVADLLGQSRAMFAPLQQAAGLGIMAGAPNAAAGRLVEELGKAEQPYSTAIGGVISEAGRALPGLFGRIGDMFGDGVSEIPMSSLPQRIPAPMRM